MTDPTNLHYITIPAHRPPALAFLEERDDVENLGARVSHLASDHCDRSLLFGDAWTDSQHLLVGDRPASRCRIGLGVNGYATLRLTGKVLRSMLIIRVTVSTEDELLAEPPRSSSTPSKLQLQPVLHDARIHAHSADLSESARTRDIARGICKVRVIKNVENLPAEDDPDPLCECGALDEGRVEVVLVRPSKDVPS